MHHQLKNWHHWLYGPLVQGVYRHPNTTMQNSTQNENKNLTAYPKDQSIIKYLPGISQDT